MQIEFSGSSKALDEVPNGALCVVKWRDRAAFAVRGFRAGPAGQEPMVALLGPPVGGDDSRMPCLRALRALDAAHALELSNGRILPDLSPETLQLGWPHEWVAGHVAVCGSDVLLFAEGRGGPTAMNLGSGEIAPEAQRPLIRPPAVAYTLSWSIVLPLGLELREIFRFAS